jgi:hypothetical protein
MEYRAVGYRCVVDIDSLQLPISKEEVLSILAAKNFKILEIDITALARNCIGVSEYRRGARLSEAPATFDCSSFIKWLYGQCGLWLPRRSIQQRELGESIELNRVASGDAVFVSGSIDYYQNDPADGVGHVGIATGDNSVIHAGNSKVGIIENSLDAFVGKDKFRGARRYIPKHREIVILETPIGREVEIADDIKWIVLQSL